MKTMKTLLAGLLLTIGAGTAIAGPDFTGPSASNKKLAASEEGKKVILPEDDIVFANNSHALMDSTVQQIDTVATWMKKHPTTKIVLEGHSNSLGAAKYNAELATKRAEMVRMHLIGHGVSSDRIIVVVYGEREAEMKPSPIDRRVVMYATTEAAETISRRTLRSHRALSVTWTRGDVLMTETKGTMVEQVAVR